MCLHTNVPEFDGWLPALRHCNELVLGNNQFETNWVTNDTGYTIFTQFHP